MTRTTSRPFHTWVCCSISPGLDPGRRREMYTRHIHSHHHPQPELFTTHQLLSEESRSTWPGLVQLTPPKGPIRGQLAAITSKHQENQTCAEEPQQTRTQMDPRRRQSLRPLMMMTFAFTWVTARLFVHCQIRLARRRWRCQETLAVFWFVSVNRPVRTGGGRGGGGGGGRR